ncbi:hypothetical protein B7P43_G10641 [Cryptotermes secundus]|uniref:Reverse transcriptase domain-containing protein n=1 Tax=Cryptotermes secundus TaxID=105785 RepID=A0A2J7R162_9NEOP|nr:hypothetical protein B7P43_G10641 [Cryptotermes secundus]
MLEQKFETYFPKNFYESFLCVRDPFQVYNHENDLSLSKKEQYVELSSDSGLKIQFRDLGVVRFWIFSEKKKWEYDETVHQLFIDFKKAYDSVMKEVLYNILIELGIPMKLVRLIKMCLNETYSKVCIGKHLSDKFRIQNGLKQGDALSPLLFNFTLENERGNQVELKLNGTHQLLVCADDVNLPGDNVDTVITYWVYNATDYFRPYPIERIYCTFALTISQLLQSAVSRILD